MMYVKDYLNDGANWQAQMVLAYIRSHEYVATHVSYDEKLEDYLAKIYVGRYENCREQGYIFSIIMPTKKGLKQKNYAVYEHRNSDALCVLISTKLTTNTPGIGEMWADKPENATKYDYDKEFACGEAVACAEFILVDMAETINEWKNIE